MISLMMVFALCWGFGAALGVDEKEHMFNAVRIKMQQFCTNAFSDFNSPFEFFFDFQAQSLVHWDALAKNPSYGTRLLPGVNPDCLLERPFLNTQFNIATKTIAEIMLACDHSVFLRGPKGSGKKALSRHLRRFSGRQGVLSVLGPNPCKGVSDVVFACLANLNRKKKFLHSQGGKGVLLMIEDVCMAPPAQKTGLLEFIRQVEVSGQFFDPGACEMLRVKNLRHVLTSHDVDARLDTLEPYLSTLSVEKKDISHLEAIFEIGFQNFLNSLSKADNLTDLKFVKSFTKVVRTFLSLLDSHGSDDRDSVPGSLAQRLLELEKSLWQVDSKNFITRLGLINVFHCEFQRLFVLGLPSRERQEEFKRKLPKKLQSNLNASVPLTEAGMGVVSRVHLPGSTCFVSSREEHIKKLIENVRDLPSFCNLTLNDNVMNYVLELNRFLDSGRPIWVSGRGSIGKRTAVGLACHLSSFELLDFGARYIHQENLSLSLHELFAQNVPDKVSKAELKEQRRKGAKKWMNLSQNPGAVFSSIENTLASVSRAENNSRVGRKLRINPLLEMLKELLMQCFAQVLLQKKYFVLMIGPDLLNFAETELVDEVCSVLESLVTPFEVVSCFRKKELQRLFTEGSKRDKGAPQDANFRDWFR